MNSAFDISHSQIVNLSPNEFESTALAVFRWQGRHCSAYARYLKLLDLTVDQVTRIEDIPFLPVDLFRQTPVLCGTDQLPDLVFESSGTSGANTSRHYVLDPEGYRTVARAAFERLYGPLRDYCILALLPSYLERAHSSLVYMVRDFMEQSGHPESGFYLNDYSSLHKRLTDLKWSGQKTLLIGVSYALLDFAKLYPMSFPELRVMETGGMKGNRPELSREALHGILAPAFGVAQVHSEYGMTELLSQAYSLGGNRFFCPPWMRVLIREKHHPMRYVSDGRDGGINVIDLANLYSCSFIELQDAGFLYSDGSFAVLGRLKDSPLRGCNLMLADAIGNEE